MQVPKGSRVELVFTDDPYTDLKPGDKGTVQGSDDFSTWVKWDTGSSLGMVHGVDRFRVITDE